MLELSSPDFLVGRPLPARCAADGENLSPALAWTGAPRETRSLALVVTDPDAPGAPFTHWVAWNIASEQRALGAGVAPADPTLRQGLNDYGRLGWGGPYPPAGKGAHRYVFRLYALDRLIDVAAGATREAVEGAMHGRVLATAELMGKSWRVY